jgi:superfamily II DNA helicase RecQ
MAYRFFTVPIHDAGESVSELNGFLKSHRVLSVDRRWVDAGPNSYWAFCVEYWEGGAATDLNRRSAGRNRLDYREILPAAEFAVFARLRQWRKETAKEQAVPVYTIFTNDQLAQMASRRASSRAELEQIAGVGDARIEKYGSRVLKLLQECWKAADATSGRSVSPNH